MSIHDRKLRQFQESQLRCQAGVSLLELMIGLALSAVVTATMVALMANSMGTATRIIEMSQLSDELRNAMSMMTRDMRRANYSAHSLFCYGNSTCGESGGSAPQVGDIYNDTDRDCLSFTLDRNSDGNAANDSVAGFQRTVRNNIGVIEMWTGTDASANPCENGQGSDWIELTDPSAVNVTVFEIVDDGSFSETFEDGEATAFTNRQRMVQIRLVGNLVMEEAAGREIVEREVTDIIYARNDFLSPTP